ncbi:hypothetical protein AB0M29_02410 [Streptomyces sp. NPDC051976]|uniref:hypothetical protein n=1 Tax=Streptomyces sp. NPDC051976 TaxID=3154947 RepID=UPI0034447E76
MSDGVALGAAIAAGTSVAVSVVALTQSTRWQKRDLFLALHEKLTHPELQSGRTLLREEINKPDDAQNMREWRTEEYRKAVSAIAMFDILGLYVKRRYIKKVWVFEEWGWLYAEVYSHGRHVIEERRANSGNGRQPWPHFQALGKKALARYPAREVGRTAE